MRHAPFPLIAAAVLTLGLLTTTAHAALVVDTGVPNGNAVGAYVLDASDAYAASFTLTQAVNVTSVNAHILGGDAGETFTVTLFGSDASGGLPGTELFSTRASFSSNGWNGASGLTGWNLAAGSYWVGFSVAQGDTLGSASATGALLDRGAPSPVARTAFNDGSGFRATLAPLSIGVRVDAITVVPEPSSIALVLAGFAAVSGFAHLHRTGRV